MPTTKKKSKAAPAEKKRDVEEVVGTAVFRNAKRARQLFQSSKKHVSLEDAEELRRKIKAEDEYKLVKHLANPSKKSGTKSDAGVVQGQNPLPLPNKKATPLAIGAAGMSTSEAGALAVRTQDSGTRAAQARALALRAPSKPKAEWHPQWKLMRVISGHQGWVRAIHVEPGNKFFVTGSADRTIKVWDLASGTLKLSLTGHISTVRGVAVSDRHPYLFSVGEDKTVKCWDLEYNKVIRHYHGHLSAIYDVTIHPTLDIIFTCGRDSVVRVWDMRTKAQVHCLAGHTNTVACVQARGVDPQVVSGSHDSTIKLWDLAAGRCLTTLTNHKKSIRSLAMHPTENTFASAAADNIKQWYFPHGKFIQNMSGHHAVVNTAAVNADGVMFSGGDNGSMCFWDYRTAYKFQSMDAIAQPGSLDSESGVFCSTFDRSGARLLTGEADKTIKIYKEDPTSTPETHPVEYTPGIFRPARY